MTAVRFRILAFLLLVSLTVPALAQDTATSSALSGTASIGCLGVGVVVLIAVGALMSAQNAAADQMASIPPTASEGVKKPE